MTPDELALVLNNIGYKPLVDTIKAIDPDLYEVIEAVAVVRASSSYGSVAVEIYKGKITHIARTLKKTLPDTSLTRKV